MDAARTGEMIRALRAKRGLTQKALAEELYISDKAVSKWERGIGCPDVSLLPELAKALGATVESLLEGDAEAKDKDGGSMKKTVFYVCPQCGNLILAARETQTACCGMSLKPLIARKAEENDRLEVETIENEYYITSAHEMTKEHYISFVALLTGDCLILRRQYPEWNLQARIPRISHGTLLWYCVKDGLFCQNV